MRARSRNALGALVLLVLAGGAVAWAWLGLERGDAREKAAKAREARVFGFDAGDVVALEVTAKGATTRLERDGEHWRIALPAPVGPADDFAANAIAERLATLERLREAAPASIQAGDLARFGLLLPRAKVEATLASGARETLALGDDSAFDGSVYVRPTSGAVLVASGDVKWTIERGTAELRKKEPQPSPTPTSTSTSTSTPTPTPTPTSNRG